MTEDKKESKIPRRMANVAFPKAKYGIYLAIAIIMFILIILYKDLIL